MIWNALGTTDQIHYLSSAHSSHLLIRIHVQSVISAIKADEHKTALKFATEWLFESFIQS